EGFGLQRVVHAAERHHAGLGAEGAEEIGGQFAARRADLEAAKITGVVDRPVARRDVVEAVEPAMAKAVEAGSGELATDHLAERVVERREDRGITREGKGQQRQGARWRDAAQGGAREIEIERALLHIGEHLRIGAESAFREDVEAERTIGVAADRLGHFGEALGGRALGGLVDAEAVMKAGFGHRAMIVAGAGWAMPLTPPMLNCAPLILPRDAGRGTMRSMVEGAREETRSAAHGTKRAAAF